MYNNFLKLVKARKSTYEFGNKKISDKDIKKIIETARWAPSCNNTQPWHFIIIRNKNTIDKLMRTAYYGEFHEDPSLIIAVILDSKCYKGKNMCLREVIIGINEAEMCIAMSAFSITLMAQYLKIDSCILSPEPKKAGEILRLKDGNLAILMIGLGYEKKRAFHKRRERKDGKSLVSYEYYGGR